MTMPSNSSRNLDYSIHAHDALVNGVVEHLEAIDEGDPGNGFYVQWFVVAKVGEPVSVWRWHAARGDYVESTISDMIKECG